LETAFSYIRAKFVATSPQASAEEKQSFEDIANAKEQELFHFSQVLKKAAVERNNAFIKARDEQIKIKKATTQP
jgi:hypothetical protein